MKLKIGLRCSAQIVENFRHVNKGASIPTLTHQGMYLTLLRNASL